MRARTGGPARPGAEPQPAARAFEGADAGFGSPPPASRGTKAAPGKSWHGVRHGAIFGGMKDTLRPGLRVEHRFVVPPSKTVPSLYPEAPEFQEMPHVFATGFLVGLVEWACLRLVNPHLDWPREQTVGTHVDLSHAAATPPGMTVSVEAELVSVDGRKLAFRVSAHDGRDLVCEGRHERFVIDAVRFRERIAAKAAAAGVEALGVDDDREVPSFDPRPVVLEGEHARLEPLEEHHGEDLFRAGSEAETWLYLPGRPFAGLEDARRFIADAAARTAAGTEVAFAIVRRADGRAVGSTRLLDLRRSDRGLEIGWTWLGAEARRTAINTECKYLLLRHAFETLGANRVQLKTDSRNERSQTAITRIGAVREGVLRRHMIMPDGHVRDTVMFSITNQEWPSAKGRLEAMLRR